MPASRPGTAFPAVGIDFGESLASRPFLFIVGSEAKEFHVHKELIGRLSPALNTLVNGNMREAQEGRVEWPDLDIDTFVRFAKFAYSGDYTEAQPVAIPTSDSETQDKHAPVKLYTHDGNSYTSSSGRGSEDSRSVSSESDGLRDGLGSDEDDDLDDDDLSEDTPIGYRSVVADGTSSSEASTTVDNMPGHDGNRAPSTIAFTSKNDYDYFRWKLPASVSEFIDSCEVNADLPTSEPLDWAEYNDMSGHKRKRLDQGFMSVLRVPKAKRYEAMKDFARPPFDSALISMGPPSVTDREYIRNFRYSYLSVFLSHARLYILADKYAVEELRCLALSRLHCILYYFNLHHDDIPDIAALAQEIFDNTMEDDPARDIIVEYFACFIEYIQDTPDVKELLRKGGDFPVALLAKVARRL